MMEPRSDEGWFGAMQNVKVVLITLALAGVSLRGDDCRARREL